MWTSVVRVSPAQTTLTCANLISIYNDLNRRSHPRSPTAPSTASAHTDVVKMILLSPTEDNVLLLNKLRTSLRSSSSPLCVPCVTPGQNIVILWHSVGHGGPQELCHEIREYWSAFIAENRGKFGIIWISEYSETKYRRYLCVERSPVWRQCHSSLFAQKRTLKWLPSVKMAIKLNLDCFKLSFGNSRRFPTVLCRVLNASNITNVYEMAFWCPETFKRNGSAQHWNNYFYLNALFWPIFDAAINHKHHDFGVDKSERDDYGHYWTISESDLVVKNAAGRWAGG